SAPPVGPEDVLALPVVAPELVLELASVALSVASPSGGPSSSPQPSRSRAVNQREPCFVGTIVVPEARLAKRRPRHIRGTMLDDEARSSGSDLASQAVTIVAKPSAA